MRFKITNVPLQTENRGLTRGFVWVWKVEKQLSFLFWKWYAHVENFDTLENAERYIKAQTSPLYL